MIVVPKVVLNEWADVFIILWVPAYFTIKCSLSPWVDQNNPRKSVFKLLLSDDPTKIYTFEALVQQNVNGFSNWQRTFLVSSSIKKIKQTTIFSSENI